MDMDKQQLLDCVRAAQFAMHEMVLYLDTHPYDAEALKKFEVYRLRYKEFLKQYEKEYGPLSASGDFGSNGFDWVKNPWPWEKEAN